MKTKRIREVVFIAHRYIGLAVSILAAVIGLTGSLLIIYGWQTALLAEPIIPVGDHRISISTLVSSCLKVFEEFFIVAIA